MKGLMIAIKNALRAASSLSYIRDDDIYITEDIEEIPPTVMFPAIEIKDGAIKNESHVSRRYVQYAYVEISVYQRVLQPEESVVGTRGVLAIKDDVITVLRDNKLGFTSGDGQIMHAFDSGEEPAQIVKNGEAKAQRKTVIFEYKRNRTY